MNETVSIGRAARFFLSTDASSPRAFTAYVS